jgi:hypothetical protein
MDGEVFEQLGETQHESDWESGHESELESRWEISSKLKNIILV